MLAVRVALCRFRYWCLLRRIKARVADRPIRVLFLVSLTAKWKCQTVYDEMVKSGLFEPMMGLMVANDSVCSDAELSRKLDEDRRHYESRGNKCVRVVKTNPRRYLDLREFAPDVVFYQQPWGLPDIYQPWFVSKFALTCYVPYYVFDSSFDLNLDARLHFHRMLWLYFVANEKWAEICRGAVSRLFSAMRVLPLGHPMLDRYLSCKKTNDLCGSVIYAPHFSFRYPNHDTLLKISTFSELGCPILDYAKRHPEFKWVFRPHPVLRRDLVRSGMWTKEETDAYYAEWERLGRASYDGDYVDLFAESRVLITDCGSFLPEYAATGKPVIHLIPADRETRIRYPYDKVISTFYQVRSLDELQKTFSLVLEERKDPLLQQRQEEVSKAGLGTDYAAGKICAYLTRILKG